MSPENNPGTSAIISWAQIEARFPDNFELNPHHKKFVRGYFIVQLTISKGQLHKAKEMYRGLEKRAGFAEFEEDEKNQPLLAAIDLAVRQSTNRLDDLGRPIIPLFTINNSDS